MKGSMHMTKRLPILGLLAAFGFQSLEIAMAQTNDRLRVPAFTAYVTPDPDGARVSREGVTKWNDPAQKILWGGEVHNAGEDITPDWTAEQQASPNIWIEFPCEINLPRQIL